MNNLRPETASMVQDCIRAAAADKTPLELIGGGTKRRIGRPIEATTCLDLSALSGIRSYQPAELVLTAAAGTPLDEIEAALAEHSQHLVFEPADLRSLLGGNGRPTLGGMVSAALSGPRRVMSGGVRDHVLGFTGVTGRGDSVKSGGAVVKNVTGYDLPKLLCGAWGTLMALTEISIRVLPRPERSASVVLHGLDAAAASRAMAAALGGEFEVSGAAWLPDLLTERGAASTTLLRLEGSAGSVGTRAAALAASFAGATILTDDKSKIEWEKLRHINIFRNDPQAVIWRVCVPPNAGAALVARLPVGDAYLDWGGGLVWLKMPVTPDGGAALLRRWVGETGGHATLVRADETLRRAVPVFEPLHGALEALSMRVKDAFDPLRILNPGRLYAGA